MKSKLCLLLTIVGLVVFSSCKKDNDDEYVDLCRTVNCNQLSGLVQNNCIEGVCECESDDFGALKVSVECTNCSPSYPLSIKLVVNGIDVRSEELSHSRNSPIYVGKSPPGVFPYEIKSGSRILESGRIELRTCEPFSLNSIISR